jgi:hypothetical protein
MIALANESAQTETGGELPEDGLNENWLPGMASNRELDGILNARNSLILQSRRSHQKSQKQARGTKVYKNLVSHKIRAMTCSGLAVSAEEMTIQKEGAQLFKAALSTTQLSELENALAAQPGDHAGVRLFGIPELRPFLSSLGPIGQVPASTLGPECRPVRAILFDKSGEQNWSLGWHQDRTIAVRQRTDVDGFGP